MVSPNSEYSTPPAPRLEPRVPYYMRPSASLRALSASSWPNYQGRRNLDPFSRSGSCCNAPDRRPRFGRAIHEQMASSRALTKKGAYEYGRSLEIPPYCAGCRRSHIPGGRISIDDPLARGLGVASRRTVAVPANDSRDLRDPGGISSDGITRPTRKSL